MLRLGGLSTFLEGPSQLLAVGNLTTFGTSLLRFHEGQFQSFHLDKQFLSRQEEHLSILIHAGHILPDETLSSCVHGLGEKFSFDAKMGGRLGLFLLLSRGEATEKENLEGKSMESRVDIHQQ